MKSFALALVGAVLLAGASAASAHEGEHFAAGRPGDPKLPARTITITASEKGKKMLFEPAHIEVKKDEQIKFVIWSEGTEHHEFVLATKAANEKHAAVMKKYPKMEHDDPNAAKVPPYTTESVELLWRFTRKGTFEYACLIPGHYEAGMHGTVTIK